MRKKTGGFFGSGESTAYRLAKHDRKKWPAIKTAEQKGDTPYYTNSSHLPVDYTTDIFDALDVQDELQSMQIMC